MFLFLLLLSTPGIWSGVASAEYAPGKIETRNLEWEGSTRSFDVYRPSGEVPEGGLPVVFDFHGYSSSKEEQRQISGFLAQADSGNFLLVWAQGSGNPSAWNAGICCRPGVNDLGLVRAIVDRVASETAIDSARIYATGLSNGGAISQRLACEADDLFAAVSPAAFPIPFSPLSDCQPSRPIAISMVMGLTDVVIPYAGGIFGDARESLAHWRDRNGCGEGEADTLLPLAGEARCETYTSCAQGVETQLCSLVGIDFAGTAFADFAGHILYFNDSGYDVAAKSWQFMSRFAHPTPPALPLPESEAGELGWAALLCLLAVARGRVRRRPNQRSTRMVSVHSRMHAAGDSGSGELGRRGKSVA